MIIGLVVWTCDVLQPLPENPFDPLNPEFKEPETRILSGPSGTVSTREVTIIWQPKDPFYRTGNIDSLYGAIAYTYRLNQGHWSPFFTDTFVTLSYLDDTSYFFQVMARYPTNITEDEPFPSRSWTMDAYSSALMITPRTTILSFQESGDEFVVNVTLKDVSAMMGVHIELFYDPEGMSLKEYAILKDSSDFLTQSGGSILDFVEWDSLAGSLTVDLALVTGAEDGLNGSGEIMELKFQQLPLDSTQVDTFYLEFGAGSALRNLSNEDILLDSGDGVVYVW